MAGLGRVPEAEINGIGGAALAIMLS